MVQDRDPPYGPTGRAVLAVLEKEIVTTEVANAHYLERPQHATSLTWNETEIVEKPHSMIEFQVTERVAELILGNTLEEIFVRICGSGFDIRVSWIEFCRQSSDRARAVRTIVGKRAISLLRLAYQWPRAEWFQPVARDAVSLLLQELR